MLLPPGSSPGLEIAMATLEIRDTEIVVHIHGWDKLLALRSTLTIPLAHVKGAAARPADAEYDAMEGARLAGGYWPKAFAAGYFWVMGGVAAEKQSALEKLQAARKDLAGDDPDGSYAAAAARIDEAIAAVKKGLAHAKVPEERRYLAFYDVHDPARTIGLDVEHGHLRRVVIELDDEAPEAAVARVQAALAKGAS
jgi:hypothetical protein